MKKNIIEVKNLSVSFFTHLGEIKAVRDVSFKLKKGETLGIVGESGSGKSVTAKSIMKLLQFPGKIKEGVIKLNDVDLIKKNEYEMTAIRGNEIAMIFQDPMTSLNPVFTIGGQIAESLKLHRGLSKKECKKVVIEMLELVGISSPEERYKQYPHHMSGGMRQRVMIAMALCCKPLLLIADEPTTALDVTIQAQILDLINQLKVDLEMSVILISHDLGVIADVCQNVIVMYGGKIMESGDIKSIFLNAMHPYTKSLLNSIPTMKMDKSTRLYTIKGTPPDLLNPPKGCPFAPRCDDAMGICNRIPPDNIIISQSHSISCWLYHKRRGQIDE